MREVEKDKQPVHTWLIDAVEKHVCGLYSEVAEASEKYRYKCEEILTFIDVYQHPGDKEQDVPAHWHYITYGISCLKQKQAYVERNDSIHDEEAKSSCFELTFRLKYTNDGEVPPQWPVFMLESFARYVQLTGNVLSTGDHIPWNRSLDIANPEELDSSLCHGKESSSIKHLLVAEEPELMTLVTDQCNIHFRQLLGILEPEMKAAQYWKGCGLLDLCSLTPQAGGPYFVTDMSRELSVFDYQPYFIKMVGTKISSEGSNLAQVTALCYWEGVSSSSLASGVKLDSDGTLVEEFTLKSASIYLDKEASELLSVAARGRLAHGKHFMYESPHGEAILLIPPRCTDDMVSVNSTTPLKALGTSLQVYCGNDFISQLAEAANTFNLRYQHTVTKEIHLNYPRVKIVISNLKDGPCRSKVSFNRMPSDVKDSSGVVNQNKYLEGKSSAGNCKLSDTDVSGHAANRGSLVGSDSDIAAYNMTTSVQEWKDMVINKVQVRHSEGMAARSNFDENEILLRSTTQLQKHYDLEIIHCSCQDLRHNPLIQAPAAIPHRKSPMIKSVIPTAKVDKCVLQSSGSAPEMLQTLLPQSDIDELYKDIGDKPVAYNNNIRQTQTEVPCTEDQSHDNLLHVTKISNAMDSNVSTVNHLKHHATSMLNCKSKYGEKQFPLKEQNLNCTVANSINLGVMTSLSHSDSAQRKQNGKQRIRKTDTQPVKIYHQMSALVQSSIDLPLQELGNTYSLPRSASKKKDCFSYVQNWHSLPRTFSKSKDMLYEEQSLSINEKLIAGFSDLKGVSVPILDNLHAPYMMRKKSALQKSLSLKCLRAASPVFSGQSIQHTATYSTSSIAKPIKIHAKVLPGPLFKPSSYAGIKPTSVYLNDTMISYTDMEWDPELTAHNNDCIQGSSQFLSTTMGSSIYSQSDKSSRQRTKSGKDKYYKTCSMIPNKTDVEAVVVEATKKPCSQRTSDLSFVMEQNEDPNIPLLSKLSSNHSTPTEYITNGKSYLLNHNKSVSFKQQIDDKASGTFEIKKVTDPVDSKLAFDITVQSVSFIEPLENTNFVKASSFSDKEEEIVLPSLESELRDILPVQCTSVDCTTDIDSVFEKHSNGVLKDNIIIPKPVMRKRKSRSQVSTHHAAAISLVAVRSENV